MSRKWVSAVWMALALGALAAFGQEREPNDQKGQADLVTGLAINATMSSGGDVDWFVLDGQEGTRPTFTITHAPGVDFDFEVYNGEAMVGRATGTQSGDSITCNVPGRCYLRVWSFRGSGAYTLFIRPAGGGPPPDNRFPPPPPPPLPPENPNPQFGADPEPNDTMGQATPCSAMQIRGAIGHPGDVDWFVLAGQEGTRPRFTILHAPGNDFDFEVYNEGRPVGSATGVQSGDSITCSVPGRCHVRVWSCRGTGPYTITIGSGST